MATSLQEFLGQLLPLYPELSEAAIAHVCDVVRAWAVPSA